MLLTTDGGQLPLSLNLIANLREVGIEHYLLLTMTKHVCLQLRERGRIACAWSSYLRSGPGSKETSDFAVFGHSEATP